jgi:hypothetical protein
MWTKISSKRKHEWKKAHIESAMWHWGLKTLVKTKFSNKVIMFEKTLKFKQIIQLCYGRYKTLTL